MTCGVGYRRSLNVALLWLWRRLAATAPTCPPAWEPPCAVGAALKKQKTKTQKKKKNLIYGDRVEERLFEFMGFLHVRKIILVGRETGDNKLKSLLGTDNFQACGTYEIRYHK